MASSDAWTGPCWHGKDPYTDCDLCRPLDADIAMDLAAMPHEPDRRPLTEHAAECPSGVHGPGKCNWVAPREPLIEHLKRAWRWVCWPYLQWQGKRAARRFAERQRLVEEVADAVEQVLEERKTEQEGRDLRLQIALAPDTWPGGVVRCSRGDGGCGFRSQFPPLISQRRGDRQTWIMRCPNCKKNRVMVSLTPALDKARKAALAEFRKLGHPAGDVCRAYQRQLGEANRRRLAAREDRANDAEGPGPRPVAAAPPDESDSAAATD